MGPLCHKFYYSNVLSPGMKTNFLVSLLKWSELCILLTIIYAQYTCVLVHKADGEIMIPICSEGKYMQKSLAKEGKDSYFSQMAVIREGKFLKDSSYLQVQYQKLRKCGHQIIPEKELSRTEVSSCLSLCTVNLVKIDCLVPSVIFHACMYENQYKYFHDRQWQNIDIFMSCVSGKRWIIFASQVNMCCLEDKLGCTRLHLCTHFFMYKIINTYTLCIQPWLS